VSACRLTGVCGLSRGLDNLDNNEENTGVDTYKI
jgi:hypothetical protein